MKTVFSLIVGFMCLTGCRTQRAIESSVKIKDSTAYVFKDTTRVHARIVVKDSVVTRDSVVVVMDDTGNVKRKDTYREREVYKDLHKEYNELLSKYNDLTRAKERTDTIKIPVYIEKKLSIKKSIALKVGNTVLAIIPIMVLFWFIKRRLP